MLAATPLLTATVQTGELDWTFHIKRGPDIWGRLGEPIPTSDYEAAARRSSFLQTAHFAERN